MDFIKRHKFKLALLILFLIVFIVALYVLIGLLYPDNRKNVYGNRLLGIEKVKLSEQSITEIKDKMEANDFVNNTKYSLNGKLINFIIEVKADTNKNSSKGLVNNILEVFSDEVKKFYDIQVIIIEDKEESKNYPIFAYKHKSEEKFVWTNN